MLFNVKSILWAGYMLILTSVWMEQPTIWIHFRNSVAIASMVTRALDHFRTQPALMLTNSMKNCWMRPWRRYFLMLLSDVLWICWNIFRYNTCWYGWMLAGSTVTTECGDGFCGGWPLSRGSRSTRTKIAYIYVSTRTKITYIYDSTRTKIAHIYFSTRTKKAYTYVSTRTKMPYIYVSTRKKMAFIYFLHFHEKVSPPIPPYFDN